MDILLLNILDLTQPYVEGVVNPTYEIA